MRGQLTLGFWIILTLVLCLIVGAIIYLSSPSGVEPIVNSSVNVSVNVSIFVSSNFPVEYSLFDNGSLVSRGSLREGVMDAVPVVLNGSLLNLSGWGVGYYFNSSVCNVSLDGQVCSVSVFRKADYAVSLTLSSVDLLLNGGVIQKPILCFAWNYPVDNVLTDYYPVRTPEVLRRRVDSCFQLPTLLNDSYIPFVVHWNHLYSDIEGILSVSVYDYEVDGFENIGIRNASIVLNRNI